jgi:hypothetical protein
MMATNTLLGESVRNRPARYSEAIYQRAAEMLYERREDYGVEVDADDRDGAIEDIADALRTGSNGYDRAQHLDRHGWFVDAQVVEWLDDDTTHDAHREAVREWVKAEGILPSLGVGTLVRMETHPSYRKTVTTDTVEGEIREVYVDSAEYSIFVEAYGHVRKGTGTHGIILPYEAVQRIDEAQDATS